MYKIDAGPADEMKIDERGCSAGLPLPETETCRHCHCEELGECEEGCRTHGFRDNDLVCRRGPADNTVAGPIRTKLSLN